MVFVTTTAQAEPLVPPASGVIHKVYKLHSNERSLSREKAAWGAKAKHKSQYKQVPPPGIPPETDRPTSTEGVTGRRHPWFRSQSNVKFGKTEQDWATQYNATNLITARSVNLVAAMPPVPAPYEPPSKGSLGGRSWQLAPTTTTAGGRSVVAGGGGGDWTTSSLKDPRTVYPKTSLPHFSTSKVNLGKEPADYGTTQFLAYEARGIEPPPPCGGRLQWERTKSDVKFRNSLEGRSIPTYTREYGQKQRGAQAARGKDQVWNRTSKDLLGVMGQGPADVGEDEPAFRKQQWHTMSSAVGRTEPIGHQDGLGYAFKAGATAWSLAEGDPKLGFRTEHRDEFYAKRGAVKAQERGRTMRSFSMGQGHDMRTTNMVAGLTAEQAHDAAVAKHREDPGVTRFKAAPLVTDHSQVPMSTAAEADRMYQTFNSEYGAGAVNPGSRESVKLDRTSYLASKARGHRSTAPMDMGPLTDPPPLATHYSIVHNDKLQALAATRPVRHEMGASRTRSGVVMASNTELRNPFGTSYRTAYRGSTPGRRGIIPQNPEIAIFDMSACRNPRDALRLLGSV